MRRWPVLLTKRQWAELKGRWAEHYASLFLQTRGYKIQERRWRCRGGEIDLIALKRGCLVFVEVKARADHQTAREAVGWTARRRIEQAASIYLAHRRYSPLPPCRFDIVAVAGLRIRHFPHAWGERE